jgi:molybdopterin-guanine dinucleotide biosynthesis protein A
VDPDALEFDAIILAGGRSSRLGGVPKQQLTYDGATLLQRALDAAGGAAAAVVVGPESGALPAGVLTCREEPPFAGPAAAISAGLAALAAANGAQTGATRAGWTLVLACDMPNVAPAVQSLRDALRHPLQPGDGVVAVSTDGHRQPLVGFYSTPALQRAVQELASRGALINGSVSALLASLDVRLVTVPAGSTDDVDTWDDAAALGVAGREP